MFLAAPLNSSYHLVVGRIYSKHTTLFTMIKYVIGNYYFHMLRWLSVHTCSTLLLCVLHSHKVQFAFSASMSYVYYTSTGVTQTGSSERILRMIA